MDKISNKLHSRLDVSRLKKHLEGISGGHALNILEKYNIGDIYKKLCLKLFNNKSQ